VVDHKVSKIRLTGDRAQSGEFRRGKSRHVVRVRMRIGDAIKKRLRRRRRCLRLFSQQAELRLVRGPGLSHAAAFKAFLPVTRDAYNGSMRDNSPVCWVM